MPVSKDSDGVVPVSSATHAGNLTEKRVDEKHANLTKNSAAIAEVLCILGKHQAAVGRNQVRLGHGGNTNNLTE